jgi:hypothetical protein
MGQYFNLKGESLDLNTMMDAGYKQRYLERKAGVVHRKPTVKNGYAAQPGTGPEGKTCKDCKYKASMSNGGSKHWIKCGLRKATWTNGEGTDILARSPACSKFEPIPCEHQWKVTQQGVTYHDCQCELCGATKRESWD